MYLLLLYLTKYHLFTDAQGLDVLGSYAGLVYALPLIGGMIADRFLGMRKSVVFGGILLSLGHILMAVEGHQAINYAAGTILAHDLTLANGQVLAAGTTLAEAVMFRGQYLAIRWACMSASPLSYGSAFHSTE